MACSALCSPVWFTFPLTFNCDNVNAYAGDIFESFFGGGGARGGVRGAAGGARGGRRSDPNAPTRGEDIEIEVEIPFMTSIFGGAQTVRLRRYLCYVHSEYKQLFSSFICAYAYIIAIQLSVLE